MSKFNITVDIDYIDEDGNLDDAIREQIVNSVVSKVSDSVTAQIEKRAQSLFEERKRTMEASISDKLNEMMEEFFTTPKDVTDRWGNIERYGVTVKQLLKEACDKFIEQPMDKHGKPTSGYGAEYKSRVDYIVANSINYEMENAITRAVRDVTDNLKKKISSEIAQQMGEKLAGVVGLDDLLSNKKEG